ncbi:hypothetical protein GIB67_015483, partial [Kingdonia uniflora]
RGKAWIMQLLDVACLSLAAKMEEIEVPLFVDFQERVFKCLELIHELQRSAAIQSVPQNPIEVLDVSCLSYKSSELPTGSSANSSHSDFKRVSLNKPSDMD